MIAVSNADRVVFPEIGRTKGDVVAYYEKIASRALPHLLDRPLSIRRFPKGLAAPGFFQKNVPPHYPDSIARLPIPRSRAASRKHPKNPAQEVTLYPLVRDPEHLAYLANQGAIELHVPNARVPDLHRPDRVVLDLDPPSGAVALVRRAAHLARRALQTFGLEAALIATGSKGYHLVAPIRPLLDFETVAVALQKTAALLAFEHPAELTTEFLLKNRGQRVFVDWLRNRPQATVIAPYSLRARPRATVATPLSWEEIDTVAPDGFTIDEARELLERPDTLAAVAPLDPAPFVAAVDAAFAKVGLLLEPFDRFGRSPPGR